MVQEFIRRWWKNFILPINNNYQSNCTNRKLNPLVRIGFFVSCEVVNNMVINDDMVIGKTSYILCMHMINQWMFLASYTYALQNKYIHIILSLSCCTLQQSRIYKKKYINVFERRSLCRDILSHIEVSAN